MVRSVQMAAPLLQLPTPALCYPKGFVLLVYQQHCHLCSALASHKKKNNVESVGFFIICVEMVLRL
jgi:hypothetical protein